MNIPKTVTTVSLMSMLAVGTMFADNPFQILEVQDDPALVVVSRRSFAIEVDTIGALDTARSHMVVSEIKGNHGKLVYLANDGDWVKEGDVLARFDATPFERQVLELEGKVRGQDGVVVATKNSVDLARNQVAGEVSAAEFAVKTAALELKSFIQGESKTTLATLEGEMEKAKQEYSRYTGFIKELKRLEKEGYSNPGELEQAEEKKGQLEALYRVTETKYRSYQDYVLPAKIEAAKAKLSQAKLELARIQESSSYKVARELGNLEKAKQEYKTMQTQLEQAKAELDKTNLTAPFAGIVVLYETFRDKQKRKPRVGDTIWQGQPIMYLPDVSAFVVQTKIREVDLHKIRIGSKAIIKLDAFPEIVNRGSVLSLGALAEKSDSGGEKYFQTTIAIDSADNRMRPGMTAHVTIKGGEVKNALTVPVAAVYSEDEKHYCYKMSIKGNEKVHIVLGQENENWAEIREGLHEGDTISLVIPN